MGANMTAVSPAASSTSTVLDPNTLPVMSKARRMVLLVLFCLAQFIDAFTNTAILAALPKLKETMDMDEGEATWVVSAFGLTFASFLLVSGRISDVYNPKWIFMIGLGGLGVLSLGAGFTNSKIPLIVLRAVSGIFAAFSIPSALTLVVAIFPEPKEQARAVSLFGGLGSIGIVLGLIIGAMFVEWASWRWILWMIAIMGIVVAGAVGVLAPRRSHQRAEYDGQAWSAKIKRLDMGGVSILTAALILLIFAVTSSASASWGSAKVLAPLIISLVLVAGFFVWEARIPEERAAVPPKTWRYRNFGLLVAIAFLPIFWFVAIFAVLTIYWQQIWHWKAIIGAVHMIPLGVASFAVSFSGPLAHYIPRKVLIMGGMALNMVAMVLLHFADSPSKYWSFVFPAFLLGSSGAMFTYTHTNIAVFEATPPSVAGTVGAIFNCALQLGAAVGISAVTSIETSIEHKSADGFAGYEGRRAVWWYMFALTGALLPATAVFYRPEVRASEPELESDSVGEAWMEKHRSSVSLSQARLEEGEQDVVKTRRDVKEEDLGEIKLASEKSGWSEV